jgi:hypothetical protein
MKIEQGEIVEVNFNLPQGYLPHPVIVLSNNDINEFEQSFIGVMLSLKDYDDEYSYFITDEMLTKKPRDKYQARGHLISFFQTTEVLSKHGKMKKEYLKKLIKHIF